MKTRIKYYHGYYYPQYRKWFIWLHMHSINNIAYFTTKDEAVKFVESGEWLGQDIVVWEGNNGT